MDFERLLPPSSSWLKELLSAIGLRAIHRGPPRCSRIYWMQPTRGISPVCSSPAHCYRHHPVLSWMLYPLTDGVLGSLSPEQHVDYHGIPSSLASSGKSGVFAPVAMRQSATALSNPSMNADAVLLLVTPTNAKRSLHSSLLSPISFILA